ncbi:MAG: hypothetical protein ABWY06_17430 [Pseudomonas sp.]|uniref:hypothetical protein n=1 Tax=Pseudomonas sp. TaxID=306 RepID=UPI003398661C
MESTELLFQVVRTSVMAALASAFVLFCKSVKPYDLRSFWYYLALLPALAVVAVYPYGWQYLQGGGAQDRPLFIADLLGTGIGLGLGWGVAKLLQLSLHD